MLSLEFAWQNYVSLLRFFFLQKHRHLVVNLFNFLDEQMTAKLWWNTWRINVVLTKSVSDPPPNLTLDMVGKLSYPIEIGPQVA